MPTIASYTVPHVLQVSRPAISSNDCLTVVKTCPAIRETVQVHIHDIVPLILVKACHAIEQIVQSHTHNLVPEVLVQSMPLLCTAITK